MREFNREKKIDLSNPVKINAFEAQQLNYPLHYHSSQFELTLILGGKGLRIVGDNISEFNSYDLSLIGPGLPHCWISRDAANNGKSNTRLQVVVIHFNRHILGDELLNRAEFRPIHELFENSTRGIAFSGRTLKSVADKFLQFKLEPDFNTFLNILEIFNTLANSADQQILCKDSYLYKGRHEEIPKFESVFNFIHSNYLNKIKISEVADLIHMNDSAFSHYFKKRTSYSFTDFITLLRLNHAADLITTQKKTIAEICFNSGFNNLSNFNRMFKKWKGETPLQFRKNFLIHDAGN